MDISADLTELGRTPVAVVCAGAKSVSNRPAAVQVLCMDVAGTISQATMKGQGRGTSPDCSVMMSIDGHTASGATYSVSDKQPGSGVPASQTGLVRSTCSRTGPVQP